MHLRRPARTVVAAATAVLALAVPLSSCGFNAATDRVVDYSSAPNDRDGVVEVLSAVVVSAEEGSGTVIASLANSSVEDSHTLTTISGEGVTTGEFEPIEIGPDALVNLADPAAGITVTGDFRAGDFVELTFAFESGESASLDVPVVTDDSSYWEGLDVS
jgi:hypothetical protein